jgi:hypothetical protein
MNDDGSDTSCQRPAKAHWLAEWAFCYERFAAP